MKTELITIGDEILIGQTINTNAAWIGEQLALIGIKINRSITISDLKQDILEALTEGSKADLVIITGGLGPTKDDITKATLCEYFDTELELHEDVLTDIQAFFKQRNKPFLEINNLQAMLPKNCEVIRNYMGTASGMWFEKDGTVYISMPGVPYEMKHLMETSILGKLKDKFNTKALYHSTVLTQGIGESYLAEKLTDWENDLWNTELSLAYLPSPGIVKLRVSSLSNNKYLVDKKVQELYEIIPNYIFGTGNETLAEVVGDLLKEKVKTVSLAESCTGGYASHLLTTVPGSSAYFIGSIICYSYDIKETELNVPNQLLETKGAVSQEVVDILSEEIRKKYKTHYSVAISGIAGPDGGTQDKPVGTVWIAVRNDKKVISKKFTFSNNRKRNIQQSALTALNMLRLLILED
jgi:nicotinamide-nucleotide amidase